MVSLRAGADLAYVVHDEAGALHAPFVVALESIPPETGTVTFCALVSLSGPVVVNCCAAPLRMDPLAGVTTIETSSGTETDCDKLAYIGVELHKPGQFEPPRQLSLEL